MPSAVPERAAPKAVVARSDICLNVPPFPVVGETRGLGFVLVNTGAEDLVIRGAGLLEDERDAFTLVAIEDEMRRDCRRGPCRLAYNQFASVTLQLEPPHRGWDAVEVWIDTNDPDRQDEPLTIRLLSVAKDPEEPDAFDPGPRPTGTECRCVFPIPVECS
jgi:hypothetical protein